MEASSPSCVYITSIKLVMMSTSIKLVMMLKVIDWLENMYSPAYNHTGVS